MHAQFAHCQQADSVKMLSILVKIIVHQRMPIIQKKDILIPSKHSTDELDDTAITGKTNIYINIRKSRNEFKPALQWKKQFFVC